MALALLNIITRSQLGNFVNDLYLTVELLTFTPLKTYEN